MTEATENPIIILKPTAPEKLRHPLSAVWSDMPAAAFEEFQESVAAEGVREPILLYEDCVLDGYHRYRAARSSGVVCPARVFEGTAEAAAHASVSGNLRRRHLTKRQIAEGVVGCFGHLVKQGGDRKSKKAQAEDRLTWERLGRRYGVSPKTLQLVRLGKPYARKPRVDEMEAEARTSARAARKAADGRLPPDTRPGDAQAPVETPPDAGAGAEAEAVKRAEIEALLEAGESRGEVAAAFDTDEAGLAALLAEPEPEPEPPAEERAAKVAELLEVVEQVRRENAGLRAELERLRKERADEPSSLRQARAKLAQARAEIARLQEELAETAEERDRALAAASRKAKAR